MAAHSALQLMQVEMVLGHQPTSQEHLKTVGSRLGKDHLIDISVHVHSLLLGFEREIEFRALVKHHRVRRIDDLDPLDMEAEPATPSGKHGKPGIRDRKALSVEIGEQAIQIQFPIWRGNDRIAGQKALENRFQSLVFHLQRRFKQARLSLSI